MRWGASCSLLQLTAVASACRSPMPSLPAACLPAGRRRYKAALRACPDCPPEVRLGIAACSLRMGSTHKAEAAYQRALALAPDCTPALLGLAVLKLHISADEEVRLLWKGVCNGGRPPLPLAPAHATGRLTMGLLSWRPPLPCRACARAAACWRRRLSKTLRTRLCCCCWRTFACARGFRTRRVGCSARCWVGGWVPACW